jgi:hypothetical protein
MYRIYLWTKGQTIELEDPVEALIIADYNHDRALSSIGLENIKSTRPEALGTVISTEEILDICDKIDVGSELVTNEPARDVFRKLSNEIYRKHCGLGWLSSITPDEFYKAFMDAWDIVTEREETNG